MNVFQNSAFIISLLRKNSGVRIQVVIERSRDEPEGLKNEKKYLLNQFTNLLDTLLF
jgi:hypothetical protein